jgi:uncharacterized damage-inducible protein DinB
VSIVDEHGRPEPPHDAGEAATLLGFLDHHRATLAWRCSGLDEAGLSVTVAASAVTLGGLIAHMAFVEDHWFSHHLHGRDREAPWHTAGWESDPDLDWHLAASCTPDELHAMWQTAVARSRALVAEALPCGGLDQPARRAWDDGRAPSLRWILVHMIEEYARHNGHADLIRESIDGQTGE